MKEAGGRFGAAVGAGGGFVVAGPAGAIGGGVLGAVGEDPVRRVNTALGMGR
jgi:hypothetical protein